MATTRAATLQNKHCALSFFTRKVPPSVYTQEMLQTTEERLASTQEMQPPRIVELLDMSDHEVSSQVTVQGVRRWALVHREPPPPPLMS